MLTNRPTLDGGGVGAGVTDGSFTITDGAGRERRHDDYSMDAITCGEGSRRSDGSNPVLTPPPAYDDGEDFNSNEFGKDGGLVDWRVEGDMFPDFEYSISVPVVGAIDADIDLDGLQFVPPLNPPQEAEWGPAGRIPVVPDFLLKPGPVEEAISDSPLDAFKLFFTDELIDSICYQTNLYATQSFADVVSSPSSRSNWYNITYYNTCILGVGGYYKISLIGQEVQFGSSSPIRMPHWTINNALIDQCCNMFTHRPPLMYIIT